jgi:hypothetical protein
MKSLALLALLVSPFAHAQASEQADLVLPEARHVTVFDRFICQDFTEKGFSSLDLFSRDGIVLEKFFGDGMVIQFLLTASHPASEGAGTCHYSALFTRGRRNTVVRLQSKSYAEAEGADCSAGKEKIDGLFTKVPFTHDSKPLRHISLKVAVPGMEKFCGEGKNFARVVFRRTGFVQKSQ